MIDIEWLTDVVRRWPLIHCRKPKAGDPDVYLPCLRPALTPATPLIPVSSQVPLSAPAESSVPLPPAASEEMNVNIFIRYSMEDLLKLQCSSLVHCPDGLASIATWVQITTDHKKHNLQACGRQTDGRKTGAVSGATSSNKQSPKALSAKTKPSTSSKSTVIKAHESSPSKALLPDMKSQVDNWIVIAEPTSSANISSSATGSNCCPPSLKILSPCANCRAAQNSSLSSSPASSSFTLHSQIASHPSEEAPRLACPKENSIDEQVKSEKPESSKSVPPTEELPIPRVPTSKTESSTGSSSPETSANSKSSTSVSFEDFFSLSAPTKFYCRRCKQEFRSAIHLQFHFEMSAVHRVCDACKEDTDSWKDLLLHCKRTGHAIVCQECCHSNGNVFPPDGAAYRSHLSVQHVCETCNLHCGTHSALKKHHNTHPLYQPFVQKDGCSTSSVSKTPPAPQTRSAPLAHPASRPQPVPQVQSTAKAQPSVKAYPAPQAKTLSISPASECQQFARQDSSPSPLSSYLGSHANESVHGYQTPLTPATGYRVSPPKYQGPPLFCQAPSIQLFQPPQAAPSQSSQSWFNTYPASPSPALGAVPRTLSEGTGKVPFSESLEKDASATNTTDRYQTITRIDSYKQWSLEELRLVDYAQGRKYGPPVQHQSVSPIQSFPSLAPQAQRIAIPSPPIALVSSPIPLDNIECWTCDRQFAKWSAMIQHLEDENCPNGPDKHKLYVFVARYKNSSHFMRDTERQHALDGRSIEDPPFFCPRCKRCKRTLASLFQHFDQNHCNYTINNPPIPGLLDSMTSRLNAN